MGFGDELMVTGEVKRMYEQTQTPVLVVGADGLPRWSPLWGNNPKIIQRPNGKPFRRLLNGPHARPYIADKSPQRWTWRPYRPIPGEIFFTGEELAFARPFAGRVLIEPNTKAAAGNKDWGIENYRALARMLALPWVQPAHGVNKLPGVQVFDAPSFRHAAAVLSVCRAYVGPEGGLHHAAAAVGVPAVVIFGGFIGPAFTGYDHHRNIFSGNVACGSREPCLHCRDAMRRISVEEVAQNLLEVLA